MKSFEETFGENMLRMQAFQILFACIIAVGVIYNNARIALAERSRELSTLRVLGFRRTELARMLITEMGIVTALAIPLGCLFGKLLVFTLVASARTEFFRIPAVVGRDTYTFAALVIIITTAISSLVVVGHLRRMDMLVALKCKE
jgi:putative ABC transport system permease protein